LAGVVSALVISYVGIGVSFCLQNLIDRQERTKLVFGGHSLALGVCAAAVAVCREHGRGEGFLWLWTVAAGAELLAVALLLHFALLFSLTSPTRRVLRGIYGVAVVLEIANLWDPFLSPVPSGPEREIARGWVLSGLAVRISAFGAIAWLVASVAVLCVIGLLARSVVLGRREAIGPMLGSVLVAFGWGRDALVALGAIEGTWLGPLCNGLLVVSVADAYLFRHATLSRDLQRDYADLRDAQRELRRKEQLTAIGELAAVVAHEIRNPLAIISNSVAGLRRHELLDEEKDTLLRILGEESSRLNGLVANLLTYARPIIPKRQPASVRELLRRTELSTALKGPLELETTEDAEAGHVSADPILLRQVLDNLVDNAGQAMNWRGTVKIAVRAATRGGLRGTTISIQDNGEGMDARVSARAKDPFFTTRPTGTGLGLAIVDRIVEAHGGDFVIESQPGIGTTATVFFPDASSPAGKGSEGRPSPRAQSVQSAPSVKSVPAASVRRIQLERDSDQQK
jgi:signal transduction histidine kinase